MNNHETVTPAAHSIQSPIPLTPQPRCRVERFHRQALQYLEYDQPPGYVLVNHTPIKFMVFKVANHGLLVQIQVQVSYARVVFNYGSSPAIHGIMAGTLGRTQRQQNNDPDESSCTVPCFPEKFADRWPSMTSELQLMVAQPPGSDSKPLGYSYIV